MKLILAISIAIILSSCASTAPVVTKITIPAKPVYPKISSDALQCLPQPAYTNLVRRKTMAETHIEVLEELIKAHNGSSD